MAQRRKFCAAFSDKAKAAVSCLLYAVLGLVRKELSSKPAGIIVGFLFFSLGVFGRSVALVFGIVFPHGIIGTSCFVVAFVFAVEVATLVLFLVCVVGAVLRCACFSCCNTMKCWSLIRFESVELSFLCYSCGLEL